jgi:CDP-glycerol glycerophosphotransferase (TagB/SpsB family)
MKRYLLFATTLYALPILRPLARSILARGEQAAWFVSAALAEYLAEDEPILRNHDQVKEFAPLAVFSASNWVPDFFPGIKVQVFHGFNVEKRSPERGHFRVRGLFDLYCTQGPATTFPFQQLADRHRHFAVVETGWPKLDPLFSDSSTATKPRSAAGRRICMYAATFTRNLSSARALYPQIARLIARGEHYWQLTLHPKADEDMVSLYRALAGPNAEFFEAHELVDRMRISDVLVSDTSSVVSEFIVQGKPVVTFRNRAPKSCMLDIAEPDQLDSALRHALDPPAQLRSEIDSWAGRIHPYRDGRSGERVLAATEAFLDGRLGVLKSKPRNFLRKLQGRLRYQRWVSRSQQA